MRAFFVLVLVMSSRGFADEWQPPEKPDMQTILKEAGEDFRARRYEVALQKHVWFHHNALKYEQGMGGVRLSFALSDWYKLAQDYPPAMEKLIEIRDAATEKVLTGKDVFDWFHDMASIDKTLGEESHTKQTFETLDSTFPKAAKLAFPVAQPALIEGKAYALCSKYYAEPTADFARFSEGFQMHKKMAEDPRFKGGGLLDFGKKSFTNQTTTLIAILAVNARNEEAKEIASAAKKEWDDAKFHAAIDKALLGNVPDPWP